MLKDDPDTPGRPGLTEYTSLIHQKMNELPKIYNHKGRRLLPSEHNPRNYVIPKFKP